jgi:DNA primase
VARLKNSTVEAVKQNADFVAVVEERTPLRKAGARLTGRCPFHEERTPSFSVNAVDKLYYCFGCGAKGDMITFVRETQGLDFVGAIEWLADRFRIPIEYEDADAGEDARRHRRKRLYELLDDAATYYSRVLWDSPAGSMARDYLAGRGLGEPICHEFRLGLAVDGTALTRKAAAKGFTHEELHAAGLTRERGGDYFQRRLLFPLSDARGRVIGFQARKLHDDDPLQAKYVNTRDSELFHKGSIVYGLHEARQAIAREDRACVVEGNTDVIALRQAGFEPVVASMGTALTDGHLRELGRLTKRLWLAFDGDAAGESATLRGMELAVGQGFDVRVVPLPVGVDPADDPNGFEQRLATAKPYVVYRTQIEVQRAEDPAAAHRAVTAFLNSVPESPDRQEAWAWAMDRLGALTLRPAVPSQRSAAASPRVAAAGDRLERSVLAGVIAFPELKIDLAAMTPEHFHDPVHRAVRMHLVDGTPLDRDGVAGLAELDAIAGVEGIDKVTAKELLLNLHERQLRAALQSADLQQTLEIQEALARLHEAVASLGVRAPVPD